MDLKELSKNINLIILPSSLWAVHIHPQYHFIAILHIQIKLLSKLDVDKGIIITFNNTSSTMSVSFFIQNSFVEIPSVSNCVKGIADLTNLIYFIHNLRLCPNSGLQTQFPHCGKYILLEQYDQFCQSCLWKTKVDKTENMWKDMHSENLRFAESLTSETVDDVQNVSTCYTDNFLNNCIEDMYVCGICDKNFLTKPHLEDHLLKHNREVNFVCDTCKKVSKSFSLHKRHIAIHANNKSILCSMCGKTFHQHYKLKEHLLSHSSERQFSCDTCDKTFPKLYNLTLHKKTHTGIRPYICSSCGKAYTTQSNLSTHVRSIHTNKKPYVCSNCNMCFVHPRHLRIHMRKHTGEKPYKCLMCDKTFAKNIHLTVHTRTHTGEKPYICTFCGKGFTTTGNLSSHKRVHHKDINNESDK